MFLAFSSLSSTVSETFLAASMVIFMPVSRAATRVLEAMLALTMASAAFRTFWISSVLRASSSLPSELKGFLNSNLNSGTFRSGFRSLSAVANSNFLPMAPSLSRAIMVNFECASCSFLIDRAFRSPSPARSSLILGNSFMPSAMSEEAPNMAPISPGVASIAFRASSLVLASVWEITPEALTLPPGCSFRLRVCFSRELMRLNSLRFASKILAKKFFTKSTIFWKATTTAAQIFLTVSFRSSTAICVARLRPVLPEKDSRAGYD